MLGAVVGCIDRLFSGNTTNRGGYITEVCKDYLLHWEDKQQEFESI